MQKIAEFYHADTELKELSSEECLQKRQEVIKPMGKEFFEQIKQQGGRLHCAAKSKNQSGIDLYNQPRKYLKVFWEDGDIPIDNSASKRAIRTFFIGKKTGCFTTPQTELPKLCDEKGNIDPVFNVGRMI